MFKFFLSILFVCTFINILVLGETIEEVKQKYADYLIECSSEFPITPGDLEELKNKKMPDDEKVKCLFACAYKKAGMMNINGLLDVEDVKRQSQRYFSNDVEKLTRSMEFIDACEYVNNMEVSDGARGCDRAAHIFNCSIEKASLFDFTD